MGNTLTQIPRRSPPPLPVAAVYDRRENGYRRKTNPTPYAPSLGPGQSRQSQMFK